MTGLLGGRALDSTSTKTLVDSNDEGYIDTWSHEHSDYSLEVAYHSADSGSHTVWSDGARAGVIDGVISNLPELGWTSGDVFEHLLQRPTETAAALEGSFVLSCQDSSEDRQLTVTDKLGARPLFYTAEGPVRYASSVADLLAYCTDPTLDVQAVSDMLLLGHLWGERTLVQEILAQRPATVLEIDEGERTTTRYWKPDYTEASPDRAYLSELTDRYRHAVRRTAATLPAEAGIWLSGGLDSRATTAALHQHSQPCGPAQLRTFTYDANPPTNDNPKIARQVSETLGIENEQVPLTAATVGNNVEDLVEATDGMHMWVYGANLAATYELDDPPPVLMEGMQGALLGDHLYRHHLYDASTAVDSQIASEAVTSPKQVRSLLTSPVDPLKSFKKEAGRARGSTIRERVLDVHFQNYYSRVFMPSNRVMRDRVETRVAQADGDYLEWCAKLPRRFRKGAFRASFTPDPGIPYEPTRAKLGLIRRLDPELAQIPYERSKVRPSWPYPIHVAGFVGNVIYGRLRKQPTYGSGQLADYWIRDTETQLHEFVRSRIDDACSRDLFDADAVRTVYGDHMAGANNASLLSQITTVEQWIQNHLD